MSSVDLNAKIPNNVDLARDKRLLRALEQWQPNYLQWWREMGPADKLRLLPVLAKKLACLEAHRSQVTKTNIQDLSILESAVSCANFRGIQGRVKYAEAFQSVRLLLPL